MDERQYKIQTRQKAKGKMRLGAVSDMEPTIFSPTALRVGSLLLLIFLI